MKFQIKKWLIVFALLSLGSISPNLFVAAQMGIAPFSLLVLKFLIPSAAIIFLLMIISMILKYKDIVRMAVNGIFAGIIATIALEIFRESGFRLEMMPGDLPRLMGVLMLNQFASGPDTWSNIAGQTYHFWNGASFGLIFSLLLGQSKLWQGLLYGLPIGMVFMMSPVVKSFGIGFFGKDFKDGYQFPFTVTMAHAAFGMLLSFLLIKWNKGIPAFWIRWKTNGERNDLLKDFASY